MDEPSHHAFAQPIDTTSERSLGGRSWAGMKLPGPAQGGSAERSRTIAKPAATPSLNAGFATISSTD